LLTFEPSLSVFVAVTVTAPAVAPLHVALPRVESWALLMLTLVESETVQVASKMLPVMNAQPGGTFPMKASKCCILPGGAAVWSAVAAAGDTLMERILHPWLLAVPPQLVTAKQPKIESARKRFGKRIAGSPYPGTVQLSLFAYIQESGFFIRHASVAIHHKAVFRKQGNQIG
jgi:hypothetical protein